MRIYFPMLFFQYHSPYLVIAIVLFDIVDAEFASNHVLSKEWYQRMDKMMDLWWYFWILTYVVVNYPAYSLLFIGLFVYRFIGHILIVIGVKRSVLIYFPNIFEYLFFLLFFSYTFSSLKLLIRDNNFYLSLTIIILFKFSQEYFLHVRKLSIRETILGLKRGWTE
ncbi:MAG: hypothetical protein UT61_C0008G0007 [Candidatus Woesebacteria bacterium GW2011_GWA1_39_8]|nr:MAG: hypothetical protein UT61_C0008G0007 [Candidatus Woesebacteria bacterium GW2011_GWA1_39_8]